MQSFKVKIVGVTPYMQHRMDDITLDKWEKSRGQIIERPDVSHEEWVRAEYHAFYDKATDSYYVPNDHIKGCLIAAGGYHKSKVGARSKSMKTIVAAMFSVTPERIPIPKFTEIDKRSAVNQKIKGRVIVIRPRWNSWELEFTLTIGEDSITENTIKDIFKSAGDYVGIGSFRPTNNGSFGRFELVSLIPNGDKKPLVANR